MGRDGFLLEIFVEVGIQVGIEVVFFVFKAEGAEVSAFEILRDSGGPALEFSFLRLSERELALFRSGADGGLGRERVG